MPQQPLKMPKLPYRFPLVNIYKGPHCNTMKPTHNILVSAKQPPTTHSQTPVICSSVNVFLCIYMCNMCHVLQA